MTTTSSTPPTSTPSSSNGLTSSEWTQKSMMSDLLQQKGLLIGLGVVIGALVLFRRRSAAPEEKAARRLVRDIRHIDDADDVRDLLGENLPAIVRPALLIALNEIERQIHKAFRKLEAEIEHL